MPFKLKLNSITQTRFFNSSRHPRHPLRYYAPLDIAHSLLPADRDHSRSMKRDGKEAVGIATNSNNITPASATRVTALKTGHDFQVTTSNMELTNALRPTSRSPKAHISLGKSGLEKREHYSKDTKNSILRSLARAGHHETFESIREKYLMDAKEKLKAAGILHVDQPYHEEGKKVIRVLLENGSMPESAYFKAVGKDVGMRMLGKNVFQLELDSMVVSFQSTVMRDYCRRESVLWV